MRTASCRLRACQCLHPFQSRLPVPPYPTAHTYIHTHTHTHTQLQEFYLVCDASKLKGAANATMGPYELEGFAFNDLRPLLEKQFGQAVFFEYQEYTEAGYLWDVRKVQDEDAFDAMLGYMEEDAEGDNPVYEGTLDIKLYAAPPSKKDEAPPASKDAKAHILKRTLYLPLDSTCLGN